jgi:hypothetical protein
VNAYDISLERGRLCVVLATVVINVVVVSLLTFAPWSDWPPIGQRFTGPVLLTVAGSTRSQKIQAMLFF